ncbi:MAG: hypothetical protein ACT4PZ_12085 [Panacagrimonas sp.]
MWPFSKKTFLPPEYVEWQLQTYAWLLRNFEGYERFRQTRLVTPAMEFFPATDLKGEAFVRFVFDRVRSLADMSDWPCRPEPQEPDPLPLEVQPGIALVNLEHSPGGTFSFSEKEGTKAVITYDPGLEDRPADLVATFAHELGHYLICASKEEPPGGVETLELATDLTAVFLGFGLFCVNTAFAFRQFGDAVSSGWQSRRSGYLSEPSLLFALAIFVRLTETDPASVKPFLKPNLVSSFEAALKNLGHFEHRLAELRSITPPSPPD